MQAFESSDNDLISNIDIRPLLQQDEGNKLYENSSDTDTCNSSIMSGDNGSSSKKPHDTALQQQRMQSWQPILHPWYVIVTYLVCGIVFVSVGVFINKTSDDVVEVRVQYDGTPSGSGDNYSYQNCSITSPNEGRNCTLTITVTEEMKAPVLIHYELSHFYQNHRLYVTSRDDEQLKGAIVQTELAKDNCKPLQKLGDQTINPCGLVANTFFNDVIKLSDENYTMEEKGIAWNSDVEHRFKQPEGFRSEQCDSCDESCCNDDWSCNEPYVDEEGKCFKYNYPNDNETLYLHEIYPMAISPLEGVTNEHFIVWMRTASQPTFRKLYGYIETDIPAGTELEFSVRAYFEVVSFEGDKTLILSTTSWMGGKNDYLGWTFLVVGIICLFFGSAFGLKQFFNPRNLGDVRYLRYKEE